MNVVDLHPEDLLDKEANGELTDAERSLLESHLERCNTCRFELQLRGDFAAELADDFVSQPPPKEAPKVIEDPAPPPVLSSRPGKKRRLHWLLVAAALCVGGVAGAAVPAWRSLTTPALDATYTPAAEHASALPNAGLAKAAALPLPSAVPLLEPTAAERNLDPVTTAKSAPPVRSVVYAPAPAMPQTTTADAPSMFEQENEARRRGDYTKVSELHELLQRRFPTSYEAHVSYATVGRLRLDRGDASAALASFDAYLAGRTAGGGELDESVMVGRARSLERLGRTNDEKLAWQSLLAAFPSTPWAEHARERLDAH